MSLPTVLHRVGRPQRRPLAVVDVETSGFDPAEHRVLQVAVTQLDATGAVQRVWSTLLDPGCDPGPVHVHGLTRERLAGAPVFADVAPEIAGLLEGRIFVAHNARFDWRFLQAEAARVGVRFDVAHRLCTCELAQRLPLGVADHKLATLASHWGIPQVRAHDAVDDTRVLVAVLARLRHLAERGGTPLPLRRTQSRTRTLLGRLRRLRRRLLVRDQGATRPAGTGQSR
ncbi:exonuclease domain-containing protein [Kineococcus gynurae]|uniref:Exonuclease domain-containing protein n=1 Tax=Kineococcus gynurae TaxID=452979 RepID=A0ABV5LPM7_9ACTN